MTVLSGIMGKVPSMENVFIVEKVVEFSTINLVERQPNFEVGLVFYYLKDVVGS